MGRWRWSKPVAWFLLGLVPVWLVAWEVAEHRRMQSPYVTRQSIEDCDDCGIIFVLETLPWFLGGVLLLGLVVWLAGRLVRSAGAR